MDSEQKTKKERNFPVLDLKEQTTLSTMNQPVLVVQSPKTPTLSRKLKAVSLDSEPQPQENCLEVSRDVFSMPNTPKKQIKQKLLSCDFDDGPSSSMKSTLAPNFNTNLKKFASNTSISGSQTLKTLPEINALQDFSDCPNNREPQQRVQRSKGLLERRGSNASLTIDLGSAQNIAAEIKPSSVPFNHRGLNTAKSVSNLYLISSSSMSGAAEEKCVCTKKCVELSKANFERRKSQEACGNCTIYESELKMMNSCKSRCQNLKRCHGCAKSRRKSLSNENLYVPPCGSCEEENKECSGLRNQKGNNRKAVFPRQPDLDSSQLLSDGFKLHLQNIQYLQTTSKVLSLDELRQSCEIPRIRKLQQEFWEVPLNLQEKCYVSGSQSKNRYRGVLPNEPSRVHLPYPGGYIHANYINGPDYTEPAYIATQGPLAHTCTDFWEMVWYSQCKCIVMVTGLVEKGRSKCELYFPLGRKKDRDADAEEKTFLYVKTRKIRDKFTFETTTSATSGNDDDDIETYEFEEKNEITFGKYQINYVNQRDLDDCQIRRLQLRNMELTNVEPRLIHHYWLANWPDHKKTNAEQVLKMAVDVLNSLDNNENLNDISIDEESPQNNKQENDLSKLTHENDDESNLMLTQKKNTFNFDLNEIPTTSCATTTTTLVKSRENSISEFNKEILTNRCSLDSKLQNLNKLPDFTKLGSLKLKGIASERKKSTENLKLPIICHCSAGIGRTGCFLAILNGIQQLKLNTNVDILAILCTLRSNRGGMVQTAEQYELIHRVLSLYTENM